MTNNNNMLSPEIDLNKALKIGVYGGLAAVLISAMGIIETFSGRMIIDPILTLGYSFLVLISFGTGYIASSPPPTLEGMQAPKKGPRNVLAGLYAGILSVTFTALLVILAQFIDLRAVFLNVSPALIEVLTFGNDTAGIFILLIFGAVLGTLAGGSHLLSDRLRRSLLGSILWVIIVGTFQDLFIQVFRNLGFQPILKYLFKGTGGLTLLGTAITFALSFAFYISLNDKIRQSQKRIKEMPAKEQRNYRYMKVIVIIIILAVLPWIVGQFMSEVLSQVGLFLLMGLGLNIVVGFAGLLDLGYVAFYAVGAYTVAVLTSPSSPLFTPELSFWFALPFVMLAAALAGILVGTPVLKMRGDYLAIVTLGFGEIARILALSDWFKPALGGAQGILRIPEIPIGSIGLHSPQELYYPILIFCLIAAYASIRLQDSRIGRAWMAMREDEPVAEAMGVNIVSAKLQAFVIGAIIASFSGAIFASKIGSIFPSSFSLIVSITVLVIIIVGGIGSVPGVVVGSFVIVGIPLFLREFAEYREFFYGILLIVMMRLKPEGLLPNKIRQEELHEDELQQDAWVK